MSTPIANVTATHDGELVEVNEDIGRSKFSSLLQWGDEVVIHEVVHEEQVEDLKSRYADEWESIVSFADDEDDKEREDDWDGDAPAADIGESGTCANADCSTDAEVAVRTNTGQVRHYCDEHRNRADRRGHMVVEEEWSL